MSGSAAAASAWTCGAGARVGSTCKPGAGAVANKAAGCIANGSGAAATALACTGNGNQAAASSKGATCGLGVTPKKQGGGNACLTGGDRA